MNIFNVSTPTRVLPKRRLQHRFPLIPLSIISILALPLCFYYYSLRPNSLIPLSPKTYDSHAHQCNNQAVGKKFLWYAPHSGFSNQLSEFKNAILIAGILNRSLIVPPILDHHAVVLGSCPKFRVVDPKDIRISVWDHAVDLLQGGRYISIAEIIDISSLVSSSLIQVIDLRDFVSLWCGINLNMFCSHDSKLQSSFSSSLKQCGSLLADLHGSFDKCLYAVNEDCRTTVWTYQSRDKDMMLDSFQPDEQLKKKKKLPYVRRRRDVLKTLGPCSEAESASLLAFGSLFTAPYKGSQLYVDIRESTQDQNIQSLMKKIKYFPFVPEIISSGKKFVHETIKDPFLCAQLRLLDGQFKNHQKVTFQGLKQKLESLRQENPLPIKIFLMSDLPSDNWTETYLGDLISDSVNYKVYFLRKDDELVMEAAKRLMGVDYWQRLIPKTENNVGKIYCSTKRFPDVLLYMEQVVCSCASLGFVGTAGSTIAENIELMRKYGSSSCLG